MTLGASERNNTKSKVALKAFFNIAEKWRLDNREQMMLLGLSNDSRFYKWRNNPQTAKLDQDPLFGGRSALDVMCQGRVADLYVVRQYLASAKGI